MAGALRPLSLAFWSALVLAAAVCCVLILHDAAATPRSYSSGYDATDPGRCALGAGAVSIADQTPLLGADGRSIGILRLRRSLNCSTEWGQVVLGRRAARKLKGRVLQITAVRPADNRLAPYPLALRGGEVGFGNQLAATACVRVEAQLIAGSGQPAGPVARTRCR